MKRSSSDTCEVSYFYDTMSEQCIQCIENCSACVNQYSCSECKSEFKAVEDDVGESVLCKQNSSMMQYYYYICSNKINCEREEMIIEIACYAIFLAILIMLTLQLIKYIKQKNSRYHIFYSIIIFQKVGILHLLSLPSLGISNIFLNRIFQIYSLFPLLPHSILDTFIHANNTQDNNQTEGEQPQQVQNNIANKEQQPEKSNIMIVDAMQIYWYRDAFVNNVMYIAYFFIALFLFQLVVQLVIKIKPSLTLCKLILKPDIIIRGIQLFSTQIILYIVMQLQSNHIYMLNNIPNVVIWAVSTFLILLFYLRLFIITKRLKQYSAHDVDLYLYQFKSLYEGLNSNQFSFVMVIEYLKILDCSLIILLSDQQLLCSVFLFSQNTVFLFFIMKKNPFRERLMSSYLVFNQTLYTGLIGVVICISYSLLNDSNNTITLSCVMLLIILFIIILNCVFTILSLTFKNTQISTSLLSSI